MSLLDLDLEPPKAAVQLLPNEQPIYAGFFQQVQSGGKVTGASAYPLLTKSGLPRETLTKIWSAADSRNTGSLDQQGFFTALKLVALAQSGIDPSVSNLSRPCAPPNLGGAPSAPGGGPAPGGSALGANPAEYRQQFQSLNPSNGYLGGGAAREFFMKSGLPMDQLAQIWRLADTGRKGKLDEREFAIAMDLIKQTRAGVPIPAALPAPGAPPAPAPTSALAGLSGFGAPSGPPPPIPMATGPLVMPAFEMQKPIEIMMQELVQLEEQEKKMKGELDTKETDLKAKQGDVDALERETQQLKAQWEESNKKRQEAQGRLNEIQQRGAQIKAQLATIQQQLQQEQAAVAQLRSQLITESSAVAQKQGEMQQSQGQIAALKERQESLARELELNFAEKEAEAAKMRVVQGQTAEVKQWLVDEELTVEREIKKLEAERVRLAKVTGATPESIALTSLTEMPPAVPVQLNLNPKLDALSDPSKEKRKSIPPKPVPPKPLHKMTEAEQIQWAMIMSEYEETVRSIKEEEALKTALLASLS